MIPFLWVSILKMVLSIIAFLLAIMIKRQLKREEELQVQRSAEICREQQNRDGNNENSSSAYKEFRAQEETMS
jgi:uncharacterized membrane protein